MLQKYRDKILSLINSKKNFLSFQEILDKKQQNINTGFNIRNNILKLRNGKKFAWSYGKNVYQSQHIYLKYFFPSLLCFGEKGWQYADFFLLHGPLNPFVPYAGRMRFLDKYKNMIMMEDGFFHSYATFADLSASPDKKSSLSYVFDDIAFYFDGNRVNRLEEKLNSALTLTPSQKNRSLKLIDYIRKNKLTKYNNQPIYKPQFGKKGSKKALVIDQSYNDSSIIYGDGNPDTFKKILSCAIDENPNMEILIKIHPDNKFKNKTYFSNVIETDNIIKINNPINPWSILEIVDKVYVCSSQIGFEALMAGKQVIVFGRPFYSGWGLTDDRNPIQRRTSKRSLEELVYFALIWYTHYIDPSKGKICEVEDTLKYLIHQRDR
jgi:capsule polysaccharide export protein KpsC/LpsZ